MYICICVYVYVDVYIYICICIYIYIYIFSIFLCCRIGEATIVLKACGDRFHSLFIKGDKEKIETKTEENKKKDAIKTATGRLPCSLLAVYIHLKAWASSRQIQEGNIFSLDICSRQSLFICFLPVFMLLFLIISGVFVSLFLSVSYIYIYVHIYIMYIYCISFCLFFFCFSLCMFCICSCLFVCLSFCLSVFVWLLFSCLPLGSSVY